MGTRKSVLTISAATVVILLVVMVLAPLRRHIYVSHTDIDVNSGDIRIQRYVCGIRVLNEFRETEFSSEIHKYGLCLDGQPNWKRAGSNFFGRYFITYRYEGMHGKCSFVVRLLNDMKIVGDERKVALQNVLTAINKDGIIGIDKQIQELWQKGKERDQLSITGFRFGPLVRERKSSALEGHLLSG